MKTQKFLERLIFLTQKMCEIYNQEPIDQNALDEVRKEIYDAGQAFDSDQKLKPWIFNFAVISAIIFVLYLVYCLLSEGFGL